MDDCDAKIRPFAGHEELTCENASHASNVKHSSILRDYAYPGSQTRISWFESDRRTFRGEFNSCDQSTCILPAGHHGSHAN